MHNTNVSFHKENPVLGKFAELPTKLQQPKKIARNQKKNLGFRGKVLEVTSPKSSECLLLFFVFLIFQTISQTCFEVIPCGLFKPDFAQTATFSTEICGRCPTSCLSFILSFFPKHTAILYSTTWQLDACECLQWICG